VHNRFGTKNLLATENKTARTLGTTSTYVHIHVTNTVNPYLGENKFLCIHYLLYFAGGDITVSFDIKTK